MKKATILLFFFTLLMLNLSYGQSEAKTSTTKSTNSQEQIKPHAEDIRILFPDEFKAPNVPSPEELIQLQNKMYKAEAWDFQVGDQHEWFTMDRVNNNDFILIPATCRAVGANSYIFVEDAIWGDRVDQTAVDRVLTSFETSVPRDATMGIYEKVTSTYGDVMLNVDNDDRIIIFILDIIDGYDPQTSPSYIAGYYSSWNENDPATSFGSNGCELINIDANPAVLTTESGVNGVMGTVAHEFQHLVHDGINPTMESIFNEGCSELASIICGYIDRGVGGYFSNPNVPFTRWSASGTAEVLDDYERAMCFMYYMYEQFGIEFFRKFLDAKQATGAPLTGTGAIDKALSQLTTPTTRRFKDILLDWFLANGLNNVSINPKWGYSDVITSRATGEEFLSGNVPPNTVALERTGAHYMTFKAGEDFSITVNYALSWYSFYTKLYAIKGPGTLNEVVELTAGTANSFPEFQNTYDELKIIFMANELTSIDAFSISYTVSTSNSGGGTTEIAYESGTGSNVPTNRGAGDKCVVWFNGVPGARLDSVKVALSAIGTMNGSIHRYAATTSSPRPTPLGAVLYNALSVTKSGSEKWTVVDLTSNNISASESFAVNLNFAGDPNPYVLTEVDPTRQNYYHTAVYLASESNWYYWTANDDAAILAYLIRAYVSWGSPSGTETLELMPVDFSLNQNYPNPFNPTTTISYTLPEQSNVELKLYDVLGNEVASLVNDYMTAGTHTVNWNGRDNSGNTVSSGIYFYRIKANDFVQTRKMILLK